MDMEARLGSRTRGQGMAASGSSKRQAGIYTGSERLTGIVRMRSAWSHFEYEQRKVALLRANWALS
jgi:hypothetical protein